MRLLVLVVCLLVGVGCEAGFSLAVQDRYQAAVADARIAEADEIRRDLDPISADNLALVWEGEPTRSRVLVVTWSNAEFYTPGQANTLPDDIYVWVTLVPVVRDFCRSVGFKGDALVLRLEQLLGLPPSVGKDSFVELWVWPRDLFRPCPDPEISDQRCELGFPTAGGYSKTNENYRAWFLERSRDSYGEHGYPWTRLGYTYDWAPAGSEFGVSEYVIKAGTSLGVKSVTATAEYCR